MGLFLGAVYWFIQGRKEGKKEFWKIVCYISARFFLAYVKSKNFLVQERLEKIFVVFLSLLIFRPGESGYLAYYRRNYVFL
jgi:hypothetical protein